MQLHHRLEVCLSSSFIRGWRENLSLLLTNLCPEGSELKSWNIVRRHFFFFFFMIFWENVTYVFGKNPWSEFRDSRLFDFDGNIRS